MKAFFLFSCLFFLLSAGCDDGDSDNKTQDTSADSGDTDSDTNSDMSSDTDSDTNSDMSSDTDSDTADTGDPVGYYVSGRYLYDRCGERVILRGVNKMSVWTDITGTAFSEIAKTGANVVRIVWVMDDWATLTQFDNIIAEAIDNQLIPMVELHDATGEWDKLSSLVDWWVQDDVVAVIQKYEENLLVNIGNEVGNSVTEDDFYSGYADAITRMRTAGYRMPLIIDASVYGQNIDILQSQGPSLLEHDPDSNLLFSIHMWWPSEWHSTSTGYDTVAARVAGEIKESVDMELPLIVGEFAPMGAECVEAIPYLDIMSECNANEVGWLAWSWGPGNSDCEAMDMTEDSSYDTLHDWGKEVAVTDTYSIANTSVRPYSMINGKCE